jgi:hypothetical protein
MINPKLKNSATNYTDRHGFFDKLVKIRVIRGKKYVDCFKVAT